VNVVSPVVSPEAQEGSTDSYRLGSGLERLIGTCRRAQRIGAPYTVEPMVVGQAQIDQFGVGEYAARFG
jgi:hypothetical protein